MLSYSDLIVEGISKPSFRRALATKLTPSRTINRYSTYGIRTHVSLRSTIELPRGHRVMTPDYGEGQLLLQIPY